MYRYHYYHHQYWKLTPFLLLDMLLSPLLSLSIPEIDGLFLIEYTVITIIITSARNMPYFSRIHIQIYTYAYVYNLFHAENFVYTTFVISYKVIFLIIKVLDFWCKYYFWCKLCIFDVFLMIFDVNVCITEFLKQVGIS